MTGARSVRSLRSMRAAEQRHARVHLASAVGILAAVVTLLVAPAAFGQTIVAASPDVTLDLGGGTVPTDHDVVVDNQLGLVALDDVGPIPEASDVIGLGYDRLTGDRLIAFDTTTPLPGGLFARPGDVVRYDGSTYWLEFDAAAAGLPSGVRTDAVTLGKEALFLSFDTTVHLGGSLTVADEDVVEWKGGVFFLALDGSSIGLTDDVDIDGLHEVEEGTWLLSLDTTGKAGGILFDDDDVLRYDGGLSLAYDASAANVAWEAGDVDAVPEPSLAMMLVAGIVALGLLPARSSRTPPRP